MVQIFLLPQFPLFTRTHLRKIFVGKIHFEFPGTIQNERHARPLLLSLGLELIPKFSEIFKKLVLQLRVFLLIYAEVIRNIEAVYRCIRAGWIIVEINCCITFPGFSVG